MRLISYIQSHRRFSVALAAFVIAIAAGTLASSKVLSSSGSVDVPPQLLDARVIAAQFVSPQIGYALTPMRLARTADGGSSWASATPSGSNPSQLRAFFFIDSTHGWVAFDGPTNNEGAAPLEVDTTVDGGSTWTEHQVAPPSQELGESAGADQIGFVDASNGFVLARYVSSPNFSFGDLWVTNDGGITWSERHVPFAGRATFVDPSIGWLAGGPGNAQLDVTRDGGSTWTTQPLPFPSGIDRSAVAFQAPTFVNRRIGFLPATTTDQNPQVVWFRTSDAGSNWTLARQVPLAVSSQSVPDAAAATPSGHLVTAIAHGTLIDTDDRQAKSGLPLDENAAMSDLQFLTDSQASTLVRGGVCATFKSHCSTYSALFATSDGGRDWTQLRP